MKYVPILLPWISACSFGLNVTQRTVDSSQVALDTGVDGIPNYVEEEDTNVAETTHIEDVDTPSSDVDRDGFSFNDGDCDDYNPEIHPDQTDHCDGVDDDCDGVIDNDAIGEIYEPNDTPWNGFFIGDYSAGGFASVQGLITTETDIDIYEFYLEDGWFDEFNIDFELHSHSIYADFVIELWLVENDSGDREDLLLSVNNLTTGGIERANWDGDWFTNDSGYYEFRISAVAGQNCDAHYELQIWMSP